MDKILEELKKLKDVYSESIDFVVGTELKGKIKILTSQEETEVHTYAMTFEQGLAYLYSVKRETLCKAIVSLNGKEIPDIVDQGNGKVQKHIWLRDNIVCGWSQMLIDQIWNSYAELISIVDGKMVQDIKEKK